MEIILAVGTGMLFDIKNASRYAVWKVNVGQVAAMREWG